MDYSEISSGEKYGDNKKNGEIQSELQRLEKSISALQSILGDLRIILSPILRDSAGNMQDSLKAAPPSSPVSPVLAQLQDHTASIKYIQKCFEDLLSRIDL